MGETLTAPLLAVFGCGGCGGDHRGVGTTMLSVPKTLAADGRLISYNRGFVCPVHACVVLASDESEETVVFRG